MNSPHNPTGTQMTQRHVRAAPGDRARALDRAVQRRGLPRPGARPRRAAARRPAMSTSSAISLGTVSKSYGLPGLRIGWLVCRDAELLARIRDFKLYTTICSQRPQRTARRARAAPRRAPRRAQQSARACEPAAAGRLPRAPPRALRVGPPERGADRLPPGEGGLRACRAGVSGSPSTRACCCCRAWSTTSHDHVRMGIGRANLNAGA